MKQTFIDLFHQRDREELILFSQNLIKSLVAKYVNATDQEWAREDLISTATIRAIEVIDALLAKPDVGENPGAYLYDAIKGTIRRPDREYLSRPDTIYHPPDGPPEYRRVETEWPVDTGGALIDFASEPEEADDLWQHCIELFEANKLNDRDMQIIDATLQGYTNNETAKICGTHVSTITLRLKTIRETIRSREAERASC